MRKSKITNLTKLLLAYTNKKSDIEISHMLSIPIEQIKIERKKISTNNMKKILENTSHI